MVFFNQFFELKLLNLYNSRLYSVIIRKIRFQEGNILDYYLHNSINNKKNISLLGRPPKGHFLRRRQLFQKTGQKGIFMLFWKISTKKLVYIGAKGTFRKILRSVIQKWISQSSTKGDPSLSLWGEGGGGAHPLNPLLGGGIVRLIHKSIKLRYSLRRSIKWSRMVRLIRSHLKTEPQRSSRRWIRTPTPDWRSMSS